MNESPETPTTAPPDSYWALSRTLTYSLSFALPLFLLYEVLVLLMNRAAPVELRNAADVLLRRFFVAFSARGSLLFVGLLIVVSIALIAREQRRHPVPLRRWVFGAMLAESAALAIVFGFLVSRLTAFVLSPLTFAAGLQVDELPLGRLLVLSLGAGLYEELVFRVLLVSGLVWVLRRLWPDEPVVAGIVAVLVSAVLFSAFHYIGPLADEWQLGSFTFRFIGGVVFSAIFVLRGFGIVAWTHALYDVFLLTFLNISR